MSNDLCPRHGGKTVRRVKLHRSFGPIIVASDSTLQTHKASFLLVLQLQSRVQLFANPRTSACQASLSFTISWRQLKLMSIESVMPSNHLILCCPLLLSSVFPSISVFFIGLALASFLSSPHSSPHPHSHSCSFLPMPAVLWLLRFWNVFLD